MILEGLAGVFVSVFAIVSFRYINFIESVNQWVILISKFVYVIGHPLMDDDQIQTEITKRYGGVFTSLLMVIFKIILIFLFIFLAIALTSLIVAFAWGENLLSIDSNNIWTFLLPAYLLDYPFLLGSLIPAIALFLVPKKKSESNAYSYMDKFLHYTFMGNKNIAKILFKLEHWLHRKKLNKQVSNQNVYISGMARAGTTALMQILGEMDQFESLSYRNLPFIFLPKTWLKFHKKDDIEEKERHHQDGIKHSLDSFEALEEPFWRIYSGKKYIKDDMIVAYAVDRKVFEKYDSFRNLVADDKIYIAKNNNHLFRAESIHLHDEQSGNRTNTIIPFRSPYEQAQSLRRQHKILSDLQIKDDFTLDYMDFLVHHEFGINHKIPVLSNGKTLTIDSETDSLDYWLDIWYGYYLDVYSKFADFNNMNFFCYEKFVDDPEGSLKNLLSVLDIDKKALDSIEVKKYSPETKGSPPVIDKKYKDLYNKLKGLAIN